VVAGKQIKEKANLRAAFTLHRRVKGGNEPIRDDQSVELTNGESLPRPAAFGRFMTEWIPGRPRTGSDAR
jgi:hypothetical protein